MQMPVEGKSFIMLAQGFANPTHTRYFRSSLITEVFPLPKQKATVFRTLNSIYMVEELGWKQ